MADMFGAPIGISAAESDVRQNLGSALQVQQTLLAIDKAQAEKDLIPSQLELSRAHAKLYTEDARKIDIANQMQQQMLALSSSFSEKQAKQLIEAKAAQGQLATINDVPIAGQPLAANDPLARSKAWIQHLEDSGAPEILIAPLRNTLALDSQHYASVEHQKAQAEADQVRAQEGKRKMLSSQVSAVLANPSMYPQMLQAALSSPDSEVQSAAKLLPPVWNAAAKTALQYIKAAGEDSKVQDEHNLALSRETSEAALRSASTAAAMASVGVRKAREKEIQATTDYKQKYLGPLADATIASKEDLATAREATISARVAKEFQALPLDVKQQHVGGKYSIKLPDGSTKYVQAVGAGADGKMRFEVVSESAARSAVAKTVPSKAYPSAPAAAASDASDEGDD